MLTSVQLPRRAGRRRDRALATQAVSPAVPASLPVVSHRRRDDGRIRRCQPPKQGSNRIPVALAQAYQGESVAFTRAATITARAVLNDGEGDGDAWKEHRAIPNSGDCPKMPDPVSYEWWPTGLAWSAWARVT